MPCPKHIHTGELNEKPDVPRLKSPLSSRLCAVTPRAYARGSGSHLTMRKTHDNGVPVVLTEAESGRSASVSRDEEASASFRRELLRRLYSERLDLPGFDPTRFGDWEYGGRCTDF